MAQLIRNGGDGQDLYFIFMGGFLILLDLVITTRRV